MKKIKQTKYGHKKFTLVAQRYSRLCAFLVADSKPNEPRVYTRTLKRTLSQSPDTVVNTPLLMVMIREYRSRCVL